MRYYDITITSRKGKVYRFSSETLGGKPISSALRVDLDIWQQKFHQATQNSYVRLYGISYEDIGEYADLNPILPLYEAKNYAQIVVKAGMSKGLPLAKPKQQGILVDGVIGQAFANWVGNEITLDLVILPRYGSPTAPVNLPLNWIKDQTLDAAVKQALNIGYKDTPVLGKYSPKLKYPEDQKAIYYDLEELATYIYRTSKSIIPDNDYQGATITYTADGFILSDGTDQPAATTLEYTDFIGNITWLDTATIQAKLVMRGDLTIDDVVKFPKKIPQINLPNTFGQFRNNLAQTGDFPITQIHHVGSSRQTTGDSWVTIINCKIEQPK